MKFLLIALTLFSVNCLGSEEERDWQREVRLEKARAAEFIDKLPEYACFTQVYQVEADLPWEIGGRKTDNAYMLIRKSPTGFLFAQPVPECQKRNSCGYWIRSTTYEGNVWTHNLERTTCPPKLNKKEMLRLIKTEYAEEYTLKYPGGHE